MSDSKPEIAASQLSDALANAQREERSEQEADLKRDVDVDARIAETLSRTNPD